jgi:hypothetical protein
MIYIIQRLYKKERKVYEISTIYLAENTTQKNISSVGCVIRVVASEMPLVIAVTAQPAPGVPIT